MPLPRARALLLAGLACTLATPAVADARAGVADRPWPGVERRLHLDSAAASSFLWTDFNRFQENYHPSYVGDDDPKTAWVEGADGDGKGEWIRLPLSPLEGASRVRLRLRNGYQKSTKLFAANARIRAATIVLLPSGKTQKVTLTDTAGWQEVTVSQPPGPLKGVELRVDSVYPGTKYQDLCLSDVQVFVTATDRENPAYEKGKQKDLLDWKKARVASAKIFKSKAATAGLPLAPGYTVDVAESSGGALPKPAGCKKQCETRAVMAALRATADARGKALLDAADRLIEDDQPLRPVALKLHDRRPLPIVDGFINPSLNAEGFYGGNEVVLPFIDAAGLLRREGFAALEVKNDPYMAEKACRKKKEATYTWAAMAPTSGVASKEAAGRATVAAVQVIACGLVDSRDGWDEVSVSQLLVYDDRGRLGAIIGPDERAALVEWRDGPSGALIRSAVVVDSWGHTVTVAERQLASARP